MSKTKITSPRNSRTLNDKRDDQIRELVFETSDVTTMKLLIAVADLKTQGEINDTLAKECAKIDVKLQIVSARGIRPSKLLSFLITAAGKGGVLSIVGFSQINAKLRSEFFASINFHRDAILKLPLALMMWLSAEEMFELARQAPDLWSRRTAIFHFDARPPHSLIDRLFANSPIPRETWSGKDALSECLENLLAKESQLRQCQTVTSEVGVPRAKEAQVALLEFSKKLLAAASSDRKIELSLWLWNMARVEAVLQNWLANLSPYERNTFENMYLDRNELLLSLAEKMPAIVRKYRNGIERDINKRKPASLLHIYCDFADLELEKISGQLHLVSNHAIYEEAFEYGVPLPRSVISEVTTTDLEKWLSGQTRKRPKYLTQTEGDLLKALYLGKPILEEANQFGATEDQKLHLIEALEKKMRVILGGSSRLRKEPNRQKLSPPEENSSQCDPSAIAS